MKPPRPAQFKFGSFNVTSQVFYHTRLSFALVNLKPLLPGHVLVSPIRAVPRYSGLSSAEISDLFLTVGRVSRVVERVYKATGLNIAIQDGPDAGQSVPHVHVHIIPRGKGDLDDRGGSDAIYGMMEGEEGNVGKHLREAHGSASGWNGPDAEERRPRSEEEMKQEADLLKGEMEKESEE